MRSPTMIGPFEFYDRLKGCKPIARLYNDLRLELVAGRPGKSSNAVGIGRA